jgi:PAS domain S-box-containing protein
MMIISDDGPAGGSTDERLHESEERFRTIFDSVNEAIFIHDLKTGAILDVNRRMCEMYGYTRDEALKLKLADLGTGEPPYSEHEFLDWIRKAAQGGPQLFRWKTKHKTGRYFWVEVNMRRASIGGRDHTLLTVRDIDSRKKFEGELRKSEKRYRGLFETLPDGFASVGADKKIIEANPAFQAMTGYTQEELSGISYDALTPNKWHGIEDRIIKEQVLKRGYSDIYEKEFVKKDGTIIPIEIRAHAALEEDGKPGELWGFVRDITERKQAERDLQEGEEKFRTIFEKSIDPIVIFDGQRYVDCNEAALTWLGCTTKEQLLGLHPVNISPERQPDGRLSSEKAEKIFTETYGKGSNRFEWMHRSLRGNDIWVEVSHTVIYVKGKKFLYSVWRDIRPRKQAEKKLTKSETKYKTLFESANDAIFLLKDSRFVDCNARSLEMFGCSRDDIIGQTLSRFSAPLQAGGQEAQCEAAGKLKRVLSGEAQSFEWKHQRYDGTPFDAKVSLNPVHLGGETIIQVLVRDITESKRAEDALRTSRLQLSEAMDLANIVYWEIDTADGMFVFNDPFYAFHGTTAEHEGGYRMTREEYAKRFVYPDDLSIFYQVVGHASGVSTAHRVLRLDGEVRHILVRSRVVKDSSGRIVKIYGANQDITERKKMEAAILESEEKFRFLFEKSADPTLLLYEGTFIDCNEAALKHAGCSSREDLIGLTPADISPERQPDGRLSSEKAREIYETTLREGTNHFEWMRRTVTGEEFWVDISHTVIPIQGKKIVYTVWRDIRERKHAEEALRQAEAKYRAIFENATMGIYQTTAEGRIVIANAGLARIFGYASPQILMNSVTNIGVQLYVNPHDRVRIVDLCMKTGFVKGFETQLYRKDRSIAWVSINTLPIKDTKGNIAYLEGTMEDITARKQAEDELKMAHQRLFDIIEFLPDATFVIDEEKKVVAWNLACENMTGVKKEEIIGKGDYAYTIPFYGEKRPILIDYVTMNSAELEEEYLEVKKTGHQLFAQTIVPALYNGKGAFLSANASPLFDRTGKVVGAIESLRDITEFKRLETQLRQSQKMEAIGTLAGGIAHDFNNILTALIGYAGLLKIKIADNNLHTYVDQILLASQKATDLVHSLLAFSKQQVINLKPVSINRIITGTEKLLKRLVTEDITIKTSLAPEDITIMADATQIDQILFNLATNARDAMPQGGVLTIETQAAKLGDEFRRLHGYGEPGQYALLSVSDTGVGMDEITRERIFDPFFTTKEAGKGTGLGLSTVYGIVKQHNGYISAYSEPSVGTTFHIYLPTVDESGKEEESSPPPIKKGDETVLVAEDNEAVRELICRILIEYGYTPVEAIDGADAVEQYTKADKIDLLILDSVMPNMNGRKAYDEIRKINPKIKAVFTSGYTRDVFQGKGIEDKQFNFLQKPVSPSALIQKVRDVLDDGQE